MYTKIRERWNSKAVWVLVIFASIMLVYHLMIREYFGDVFDSFSKVLDEDSLINALISRYQGWSSRTLIESALFVLCRYPVLCRAVNFFVCVVSFWAMLRLTHYENEWFTLAMLLIYPITEMSSAGWTATWMNYYWPLTAMLIAAVSLDKLYHGQRISLAEATLYLICELYGTNFEILSVVYLGILCYVTFCMIYYRKECHKKGFTCVFIGFQYLISVGNLAYSMVCPGNWNRYTQETERWFKSFPLLTPFDKLALGINDTFDKMTNGNLIFLCFSLVLLFCVATLQIKSQALVAAATLPVGLVVIRTLLKPITEICFPDFKSMLDSISYLDGTNYMNPRTYIPFVIFVAIIVSICVCFLQCFEELHQGVFLCVIFLLGVLSRVTMGFSPTVYASGQRTFLFLDFALIFCAIQMVVYCRERLTANGRMYKALKYAMAFLAVVSIVGNAAAICAMN